jgi:hypothetical protein
MIHHVVYFQLKPEVDDAVLEEMVRGSRSLLLRIPEVLAVKSGRNLDTSSQWRFFVSFETGSLEKLRAALDDPFYLKFTEKLIRPHTLAQFPMDFEMDPSKDLRYS